VPNHLPNALQRLTSRLSSGKILIDGVDISKLGLNTLRSRIAIIPQEPILFSGTLRSNLDPFDLHDDEVLHEAMKRSCLAGSNGGEARGLTLDTEIEDEGGNLSTSSPATKLTKGVGERSLVSLARALVKNVSLGCKRG
jgi:ABC-type multidrug transport system fused ATPase/permease subunit